jgi:hypothetical protein
LHNIAIAGEYQRILSKKTGFTAEGGVSDLFCSLDDGLEPSSASRRAVRHGNLDGNAPDLVRVTGMSETIARATEA